MSAETKKQMGDVGHEAGKISEKLKELSEKSKQLGDGQMATKLDQAHKITKEVSETVKEKANPQNA
jgi:hypothetical protein